MLFFKRSIFRLSILPHQNYISVLMFLLQRFQLKNDFLSGVIISKCLEGLHTAGRSHRIGKTEAIWSWDGSDAPFLFTKWNPGKEKWRISNGKSQILSGFVYLQAISKFFQNFHCAVCSKLTLETISIYVKRIPIFHIFLSQTYSTYCFGFDVPQY